MHFCEKVIQKFLSPSKVTEKFCPWCSPVSTESLHFVKPDIKARLNLSLSFSLFPFLSLLNRSPFGLCCSRSGNRKRSIPFDNTKLPNRLIKLPFLYAYEHLWGNYVLWGSCHTIPRPPSGLNRPLRMEVKKYYKPGKIHERSFCRMLSIWRRFMFQTGEPFRLWQMNIALPIVYVWRGGRAHPTVIHVITPYRWSVQNRGGFPQCAQGRNKVLAPAQQEKINIEACGTSPVLLAKANSVNMHDRAYVVCWQRRRKVSTNNGRSVRMIRND